MTGLTSTVIVSHKLQTCGSVEVFNGKRIMYNQTDYKNGTRPNFKEYKRFYAGTKKTSGIFKNRTNLKSSTN
jgi:hypothetical protein